MTLKEILESDIIPELTLICLEDSSGNCLYCGQRNGYTPERDYKIQYMITEAYGKFCGMHGITFVVSD